MGAHARRATLRGARFEDRPQVRRKTYFTTGLAMIWIFADSFQLVEVGEG